MKILPSSYLSNTIWIPIPVSVRDDESTTATLYELPAVAPRWKWFDRADLRFFFVSDAILAAAHRDFLNEKYNNLLRKQYLGYPDMPPFGCWIYEYSVDAGYAFSQKEYCKMFGLSPARYLRALLKSGSALSIDAVIEAFCVKEQLLTHERVITILTRAALVP